MSGKQHVDFHRKVLMRQHLMRRWSIDGAAYVPFIGDADLAALLYGERIVYGADLDEDRVKAAELAFFFATAQHDYAGGEIRVADCDTWPFPDMDTPAFAVGDFDSYAYPYASFRAFWRQASLEDRVMLFFTDGEKQPLMRTGGYFIAPDGEHRHVEDLAERRRIFNGYMARLVWPWFEDYVAPWRVVDRFRYARGWMIYWGAVVERA